MKLVPKIGLKIGQLRIVKRDVSRLGCYWICQCECGKLKSVRGKSLSCTKSCGCLRVGRKPSQPQLSESQKTVFQTVSSWSPTRHTAERFAAFVLVLENGCWIWMGAKSRGYGIFTYVLNRKHHTERAHRFAYRCATGINPSLQFDHIVCDNPSCVNPNHVKPSTARDNSLRSNNAAAKNARKTHCKHGHPFTADNLCPWGKYRQCLACYRARLARLRGHKVQSREYHKSGD